MEQNQPLVVCSGLTKSYGSFTALKNLDLNLERGRFIGLLGPNGSGTRIICLHNKYSVPHNFPCSPAVIRTRFG